MDDDKELKEFENLPEGWKRVKLGEVCKKLKAGGTPARDTPIYWGGNIPFALVEDLTINKYLTSASETITEKGLKNSSAWMVPKNSILLSIYASLGELVINKIDTTTNQAILGMILKEEYHLEFIYYLLKFNKNNFEKFTTQTTQKNLNKKIVSELKFALPKSIVEQQKIAEILETIDNAIEKSDKIIEKYKRIKQGLMQDLLTKGIDENGNIRSEQTHKFKDSPLSRIPEEWEVVRLGEVCDINPERIKYERGRIIKYIDIESINNGNVSDYKIFKIEEAPSRAQRIVREYDILISTVRPNLKAFTIIKPEYNYFICSTGFAVISSKSTINPLFLFHVIWFDEIFLKQVLPLVVGSNYPAVNSKELINVLIPLPSLPEQQRIAEILSQIDQTIEKEQQYKEKLQKIKQGLMQDLLTGKVRVNHLINEGQNNEA